MRSIDSSTSRRVWASTPSIFAAGVIVEDFDNDGFLDIVTSTYHPTGSLSFYRSEGNGTFTDRTSAAGLDCQLGGLNCLGADYDNDGDVDILVLRGAWLMDDGQIRIP